MPSLGPQLPPELQKRKRSDDEDDEGASSDSSTGPAPPDVQGKGKTPPSAKRARVIGPTLPPARLDERPASPPDDTQGERLSSDDEDDDDFGPSLPSSRDAAPKSSASIGPQIPTPNVAAPPPQRDEWMTLAPSSGDWASRVDPTKLKNRKFNTGRGAKAPPQATTGGSGGGSSWHETPEEKQARLKREVMGIKDDTQSRRTTTAGQGNKPEDEATAQRLKEYNVSILAASSTGDAPVISSLGPGHASTFPFPVPLLQPESQLEPLSKHPSQENQRGPSLYATHSASQSKSLDDDPSARAFDREKDIGGNSTINATQRRDMVKKASDFSSRFATAKYL